MRPATPENPPQETEDLEKENRQTEYSHFLKDCGTVTNGIREYGSLEKSGIVVNLKDNQFLKRSATSHASPNDDKTSSTREAFYVTIDKKTLLEEGSEEDAAIINSLPNREETVFRTKDIKYGNHNAMWEVLSGQLYGLSGLNAPDARFLTHRDYAIRENDAPRMLVASPKVIGYLDLGEFLIDNSAERFIKAESLDIWHAERIKIEEINTKGREGHITGDEKLQRVTSMGKIYELLPDYFHTEIEKSFAASKFIANWDFSNLNLNNIGCKFTLDDKGNVTDLESVFVDFGNSGVIGFGGKYKEISFDKANSEAKKPAQSPLDHDPSLTLSEEETALIHQEITQKYGVSPKNFHRSNSFERRDGKWQIALEESSSEEDESLTQSSPLSLTGHEMEQVAIRNIRQNLFRDNSNLAQEERILSRSISFKTTHHIKEEDVKMEIPPTTGFLTFSDLPRNLPIGILLKPALKEKTEAATGSNISSGTYRNSELEMAFRLSLIPDEAISYVVEKWNLCQKYPNTFPLPPEFKDNPNYQTSGIIDIFKDRRDTLVNSIPRESVDNWVSENSLMALHAEQSIKLALLQRSDASINEIKEENSFSSRISSKVHKPTSSSDDISSTGSTSTRSKFIANQIKQEIQNFDVDKVSKTGKNFDSLRKNYQILESDLKQKEGLSELISKLPSESLKIIQKSQEDLEEKTKKTQIEIIQQKQEIFVKFLKDNARKWNRMLDLDSKPNCDLLNLNNLKEIYSATHKPNQQRNQITDQESNSENNAKIHQENSFIYEEFLKIIDKLSQPQIIASTILKRASSNPLQDKQQLEI